MIDFRNEKSLFYRIGTILLLTIDIILILIGGYAITFKQIGLANRLYYYILIFIVLTFALSGTKYMFAKKEKLTGLIMFLASFMWLVLLTLKAVI